MSINDEVSPDTEDEENGDTQIWFPFTAKIHRTMSWSLKYDTAWEDLSDLDIKNEMKLIREECTKSIKVLEEAYGAKVEVKWGLISSIS